jgi:hypothetical protein
VKASQTSFSARRSSSSGSSSWHLLDCPARVGGAVECGDAVLDSLDYQSHREGEQLGLGGEVVAQRPGRPAGLVGDRSRTAGGSSARSPLAVVSTAERP